MRAFKERELDVLVATTVIEVGVDVPNATIMIVQEADRFGLAQLHQLRGRVGRSGEQSYCLLISRPKEELTDVAHERLQALVDTTDGFELADRDLELRGEGQLLGTRQSGWSELRFTRLRTDHDLIEQAHALAGELRDEDGPWQDQADRLLADGRGGALVRIIAGEHRGRRIAAPKGEKTRPTSDRVRENAFNLLGPVDDATVLDLFAGSGAMGLEALSRGAASCVFVESDRDACRVINANLETLRLRATVLCRDVFSALASDNGPYDLVLCDPPYDFKAHDTARAAPRPAARRGRRSGLRVVVAAPRAGGTAARCANLPRVRLSSTHPVHQMITAIYPGTYDPVTNGHLDVIARAAQIFDRLVVGVVGNPHHKTPMFTVPERVEFLREALEGTTNVEVDVFSELVVDFARRWEARVIVKGLRVVSDFEWEFQMNQLNRTLAPEIETVYVMASPQVSFVSSSGVKEIATFGGNVEELVPKAVARRLKEMFPNGRGGAPLSDQE